MNPIDLSPRLFPGGSLGEFNLPREPSAVLSHGKGSRLYDLFGKEFIDCSLSWGSVILGHTHPAMAEAGRKPVLFGETLERLSTGQAANHARLTVPAVRKWFLKAP
jgi:glutamate-1-semialdehyde aminotransferase